MSNLTEEILKVVTNKFNNKVENLILKINIVLTQPDMNSVDNIEFLISQLAVAENELGQAKSLYAQAQNLSSQKNTEIQKKLADLTKKYVDADRQTRELEIDEEE